MTTDHKPQAGTLAEFLLARIAEDEAAAQAATPGHWMGTRLDGTVNVARMDVEFESHDAQTFSLVRPGTETPPNEAMANATHIARWDPARVLAECEARRSIVAEYQATGVEQLTHEESVGVWLAMKALASVYADHPDYREEWKP